MAFSQKSISGHKNLPQASKLLHALVTIRAGALEKNSKIFSPESLTVPKVVAHCRKYPIPYLYTLSRTETYLYTLSPTIPYLNTLSRTIPYFNTLSLTIPYLNTLSRTHSASAQSRWIVGSQSKWSTINPHTSSASQNWARETLQFFQPIRIEYYVTRVASQLESSNTSPESSRFGWKSLLGSRLESARYSLSYYIGTSTHPPPPPGLLTHILLSFKQQLNGGVGNLNENIWETFRWLYIPKTPKTSHKWVNAL